MFVTNVDSIIDEDGFSFQGRFWLDPTGFTQMQIPRGTTEIKVFAEAFHIIPLEAPVLNDRITTTSRYGGRDARGIPITLQKSSVRVIEHRPRAPRRAGQVGALVPSGSVSVEVFEHFSVRDSNGDWRSVVVYDHPLGAQDVADPGAVVNFLAERLLNIDGNMGIVRLDDPYLETRPFMVAEFGPTRPIEQQNGSVYVEVWTR